MAPIDQPVASLIFEIPNRSLSSRCWAAALSRIVTFGKPAPAHEFVIVLGDAETPFPNMLVSTMK